MNDRTIVQHPNGYSGVLMGKSTMMIYDKDDNCIVHTCFRTPNTEKELYEVLETMPRFIEMLASVDADRKTENSSEKPNNCEECKHWNDTEDDCADRHGCRTTTEDWQDWKDKMWSEAVVTEPQTEWHYDEQDATWYPYKHEDEPKTCEWCKFYDGENCYSQEPCKAKTEPQTDWYIIHDPHRDWFETEPQTERSSE